MLNLSTLYLSTYEKNNFIVTISKHQFFITQPIQAKRKYNYR